MSSSLLCQVYVKLTSSDLEKKFKLREMSTLALAFYWVYNLYDIKLKTDKLFAIFAFVLQLS